MQSTIQFERQSIDLSQVLANTSVSEHGAQVIFTGMIRNHNQGKRVTRLSYDVFEPLALQRIEELIEETRVKWGPELSIHIRQRIGDLQVSEIGILILVSSPHRNEAYLASRHLIEGIKHTVPIWKKEYYESGESDWLEGHSLCSHQDASL
jgi:molybdopterin synthase catalytic subunit